jgi:hypothetical protein
LEKKLKEMDLTWATVDTDDEDELTRFEEQELEKAGQRIGKLRYLASDVPVWLEESLGGSEI